jgi:hypothetical protein
MSGVAIKSKTFGNFGILLVSIVLSLLVLEFFSRVFFAISPGSRFLSFEGEPVRLQASPERYLPNAKARMVSTEFDAKLSISSAGHRVPEVKGNPDIIFIGDSFTFGSGLDDEQTFVYRFCEKAKVSCANLGRAGTGTIRQLNILELYLKEEGWRPREVKLFMFLMTNAFMSGNDFQDILRENEKKLNLTDSPPADSASSKNFLERTLSHKKWVLAQSNLARIVYYFFAPILREKFSPEPFFERKQAAYKIMRDQISRFEKIADQYHFDYKIYVLHPMQDITGGSNLDTLKTIRRIANEAVPGIKVVETASVLQNDTLSYFYKFDGHLNPRGSAKIADILLQEWQEEGKITMDGLEKKAS